MRCSDHPLEVEKGRNRNIPRENRLCKLCLQKEIETEEHFLTKCTFFDRYKPTYNLQHINAAKVFINDTAHVQLGHYLAEAFTEKKKYKDWFDLV